MLNSSGSIVARYSYDPYGRTTLIQGSNIATLQYALLYAHQTSGLALADAGDGNSTGRPYEANHGGWLNRDPIAENGGINQYCYVLNNPLSSIDPMGLWACSPWKLVSSSILYEIGIRYEPDGPEEKIFMDISYEMTAERGGVFPKPWKQWKPLPTMSFPVLGSDVYWDYEIMQWQNEYDDWATREHWERTCYDGSCEDLHTVKESWEKNGVYSQYLGRVHRHLRYERDYKGFAPSVW